MKKQSVSLASFLFLCVPLLGCPTCVGKLKKNSPPFFSDELYQPEHKKEIKK